MWALENGWKLPHLGDTAGATLLSGAAAMASSRGRTSSKTSWRSKFKRKSQVLNDVIHVATDLLEKLTLLKDKCSLKRLTPTLACGEGSWYPLNCCNWSIFGDLKAISFVC